MLPAMGYMALTDIKGVMLRYATHNEIRMLTGIHGVLLTHASPDEVKDIKWNSWCKIKVWNP